MRKYEYTTVCVRTSKWGNGEFDVSSVDMQMNALGAQGWDLVRTMESGGHGGVGQSALLFIFKRECETE
jgi:hypothetical protein